MDGTLLKAINHLLQSISDDEMVDDLLLIEVDWGDHTPSLTTQPSKLSFQGRQWPLIFTDSELIVRQTLCRAADGRAIVAFPGGDVFKAPRDIQARAHKGTAYHLGLRHRLYALTDRHWPAEVDYAEWRPSVEQHLDRLVSEAGTSGLNWAITRQELEQQLVKAAFGLQISGQSAPELLAKLVTYQRRGDAVSPTDLEKSLLQAQLRAHEVKWSEVLIWAMDGADRAQELVLTGIMMDAERLARRMPNWRNLNSLRALLVNLRQMSEEQAQTTVIELATGAMTYLHHETAKSIARDAERELIEVLPTGTYNRWFPSLLDQACKRLAGQLATDALGTAGRIAQLQEHLFARQYRPQLDVLSEMETLAHSWDHQTSEVDAIESVASWANWYARKGARLDLSALKLMHQQALGMGLSEPVEELLGRYWQWRNGLNRRFAARYLGNYEAALHDRQSGVFGTHRIFDWVVRPLREQKQPKLILLVIVDGMGYPAFLHLLDQWRGKAQPVYAQQTNMGLALLPSVTSVSRKGLFLKQLPTDRLDNEDEYDKKARTTEEKALQAAFPGEQIGFYNKTNLGSGQELDMDLAMQRVKIAAVILNAIDDELKVTTATVRLPQLEDMGPLVSVVNSALARGWVVVMTADHGHTWHRSKDLRRGDIVTYGGERFAPVSDGDLVPAGAAVTDDPNIVRVQAGQKVALLADTGAYFGRIPRRGYHGGVSLEEVVVPCAFLTFQEPSEKESAGTSEVATPEEVAAPVSYDLSSVILELQGGKTVSLDLPFTLTAREARLLQLLARMGETNEAELRQALNTRRIAGLMAALTERLAAAGPEFDFIEQKGMGAQGAVYRFRTELLP